MTGRIKANYQGVYYREGKRIAVIGEDMNQALFHDRSALKLGVHFIINPDCKAGGYCTINGIKFTGLMDKKPQKK